MIYSTFVILKVIIHFKGDRYWTILEQLQSHQYLITTSIESTNIVVSSPKVPWACLLMARGILAFIRETLFVHQSKVFSVLADEIRKSCEEKINNLWHLIKVENKCAISPVCGISFSYY